MLANGIAMECKSVFFHVNASSITSKFVGDTKRFMKTLFTIANGKSHSIIFIDKIDALFKISHSSKKVELTHTKREFLTQLDGLKKNSNILVIGTTNSIQQLDEAVLRRFEKRMLVPFPDELTRYNLLRSIMKKQNHELSDSDFNKIASETKKYSCCDLINLCKNAAMGPVKDVGIEIIYSKHEVPKIQMSHFINAAKNIKPLNSHANKYDYYYYDGIELEYDFNHNQDSPCDATNEVP